MALPVNGQFGAFQLLPLVRENRTHLVISKEKNAIRESYQMQKSNSQLKNEGNYGHCS